MKRSNPQLHMWVIFVLQYLLQKFIQHQVHPRGHITLLVLGQVMEALICVWNQGINCILAEISATGVPQ